MLPPFLGFFPHEALSFCTLILLKDVVLALGIRAK